MAGLSLPSNNDILDFGEQACREGTAFSVQVITLTRHQQRGWNIQHRILL
jgi:hypothetical protein